MNHSGIQIEADSEQQEVDNMKPIPMDFYLPCYKEGCHGHIVRSIYEHKYGDVVAKDEFVKCTSCNTQYVVRIHEDLRIEIEERDF